MDKQQEYTIYGISVLKAEATKKVNEIIREFQEKTGVYISAIEFTPTRTSECYLSNGVKIMQTITDSYTELKVTI
jgi:methyl-accepting chemotaxis protein